MKSQDIIKLRTKMKLNQEKFAQLFGVHTMTVSKWEREILSPTPYQSALMDDFNKAANNKEVVNTLKNVLIGAGVVAALYFLLKNSRG